MLAADGVVQIELGGLTPLTEYDRIVVNQFGTANMGGALEVSLIDGFVPQDVAAIAASYEAALFADLDRLLERLPHDRCAVQWDVAVEFGLLEGAMGPGSAGRGASSRARSHRAEARLASRRRFPTRDRPRPRRKWPSTRRGTA